MGYWGIASYENDLAADALDAAFERVHGTTYEALMDDRNPLTYEQVQRKLADAATLNAALAWFGAQFGEDPATWDEPERVAWAGVAVRFAELGVPIPAAAAVRALGWLRAEDLEWEDNETRRRLRREKEIRLLEPFAATA